METCVVEVGLLKKKPCGDKAVSKCANCEIALCAKHAQGQMSGGKKVFLCPECARAWKAAGDIPTAAPAKKPDEKPAAAAPKPAAHAPAAKAAPPKPAAEPYHSTTHTLDDALLERRPVWFGGARTTSPVWDRDRLPPHASFALSTSLPIEM